MNNTYYKVVFQPKNPFLFDNRRRFGIGVRSISKYVGEKNSEVVKKMVYKKEVKGNKVQIRFRKWGLIDVYIY